MGSELLVKELKGFINNYVEESPLNFCQLFKGNYFYAPVLGFARGDDPIFNEIKEQVGTESMTPYQALSNYINTAGILINLKPEEVSVVSWVLPINSLIRKKNRLETAGPAPEWSYARNYGEEFNSELKRQVVDWFKNKGFIAAAPTLLPEFEIIRDKNKGIFTSTWSERHTAYACGLGTFSLNDGLITSLGIAHRLGSVVVNAKLPQAVRPYKDYKEYCLSRQGCTSCIKRCPANAITPDGHDKELCYKMNYTGEEAIARIKQLGFKKTGCGLCQVGVPCEDRIPLINS